MKNFVAIFVCSVTLLSNVSNGDESTRDDFSELARAFEGRWVNDGDINAYCVNELVSDRNAVLCKAYVGEHAVVVMIFFDPASGKIKTQWVTTDGSVTNSSIARTPNGTWLEAGSRTDAKGATTKFKRSLQISDDGDLHTWTGDSPVNRGTDEENRDVWRRVGKRS